MIYFLDGENNLIICYDKWPMRTQLFRKYDKLGKIIV
jgi:hypothetical protein